MVEYYRDLLRFLNLEIPSDTDLRLNITDEDRKWAEGFLVSNGVERTDRLVAVFPGGGASWGPNAGRKQWPYQGFTQVIDKLAQKYNIKIILLGDLADLGLCQKMAQGLHAKAIDACAKTTLRQSAAVLKKCELLICNDGGPLHIARALDVKTVSIFGPVNENVYGPYPPSEDHLVMKADVSCRPCYKNFKLPPCGDYLCLLKIDANRVFEAASRLLAK